MNLFRVEKLAVAMVSHAFGGPGSGPQGGKSSDDRDHTLRGESAADAHERVYNRSISEGGSHVQAIADADKAVPSIADARAKIKPPPISKK